MARLGGLPPEERASFGQRVNALQQELNQAFEERETLVQSHLLARDLEEGEIDISLPANPRGAAGCIHPPAPIANSK